jgi:EcsC protein family
VDDVGIFGFGGDDDKGARQTPGTALEQANTEPKGVSAAVYRVLQPILDVGIEGKGPLPSAQHAADQARMKSDNVDDAVEHVIRSHMAMAGTGGFVTGFGGFVTMPIALPVNVAEFYFVATRMTAAIAALRGYDLSQQHIRTAVLLALVGADADDLIRKAGIVSPTGRLTDLAAQQLPGPALMMVNKGIAFRLIGTVGRSTFSRLGRALPFVGGGVSAGIDTYMLKRIAEHAKEEFPLRAAGATVPAGQVTRS